MHRLYTLPGGLPDVIILSINGFPSAEADAPGAQDPELALEPIARNFVGIGLQDQSDRRCT